MRFVYEKVAFFPFSHNVSINLFFGQKYKVGLFSNRLTNDKIFKLLTHLQHSEECTKNYLKTLKQVDKLIKTKNFSICKNALLTPCLI